MAPTLGKKRQSGALAASNKLTRSSTAGIRKTAKANRPSAVTPSRASPKNTLRLTQGQKQALMDNLQLEITERARKLRAQYALQAQSLRTRLEIRVHRIPVSLRKTTIAELLETHPASSSASNRSKIDARQTKTKAQQDLAPSDGPTAASNAKKRKSELDDEEGNGSTAPPESKKPNHSNQSRPANPSNTSRKVPPSQILSPKSNNARNFPHSPYKTTMSPNKSNIARPTSPLKPSTTTQRGTSQAKAAEKPSKTKAVAPRATSKQKVTKKTNGPTQATAKRGAAMASTAPLAEEDAEDESRRRSNVSEATNASSSTTIVRATKKAPMPVSASTAATKGRVAGIASKFEGIAGNGKKIAGPKPASKLTRPAATTSGRTLRKR